MKKFSKILSVALLVAMVLSLGIASAFADGITITNTNTDNISIAGKTYNAYKLFDSTHQGDAYAYTMSTSSQFYNAALIDNTVEATGVAKVLLKYFTFTPVNGDTTKVNVAPKGTFEEAQARLFADEMQPFLASMTATANGTVPANAETITISLDGQGAGKGYYLVTGSAAGEGGDVVSAVILTNENPDPVVNPKADAPHLDKKITGVAEGLTEVNGALLDNDGVAAVAKVGSTVSYELESAVPDLTYYDDYTYTMHDAISNGLTYDKTSFVLTIGTGDNNTVDIEPVFAQGDKSFSLTIPYSTLNTYATGTVIKLVYKCTVNSNALNIDQENNTANLEYTRSKYDTNTNHTPDKKTYVIDINVDVNKYTVDPETGDKLPGAEFKLYRLAVNGTDKEFYKWDTTNNVVKWVSDAENAADENKADVFVTGSDGNLTQQVRGLDKGTYYLLETKAPTGYNLLPAPVEFTISVSEANGEVTYTSSPGTVTGGKITLGSVHETQPVDTIDVLNQSGTQLPSTGGIGTTIFYVVGGVLVLAAIILLVTKKRMSE